MSIGGIVVEVIIQDTNVYIDTYADNDNTAIYVERDSNSIQVKRGDIVWWQSGHAYWTTEDRKTQVDTKLIKIGYSGVRRPKHTRG